MTVAGYSFLIVARIAVPVSYLSSQELVLVHTHPPFFISLPLPIFQSLLPSEVAFLSLHPSLCLVHPKPPPSSTSVRLSPSAPCHTILILFPSFQVSISSCLMFSEKAHMALCAPPFTSLPRARSPSRRSCPLTTHSFVSAPFVNSSCSPTSLSMVAMRM
jgi:hypothetical protein